MQHHRSLPTAERLVAIYREVGMPLYDQEMARTILDSDQADETKLAAFALLGAAKAFAGDDPATWTEAEAVLASLDAAESAFEQDADGDGYLDRVAAITTDRTDEVVLAVLCLQRTRLVALEHVGSRLAAREHKEHVDE